MVTVTAAEVISLSIPLRPFIAASTTDKAAFDILAPMSPKASCTLSAIVSTSFLSSSPKRESKKPPANIPAANPPTAAPVAPIPFEPPALIPSLLRIESSDSTAGPF